MRSTIKTEISHSKFSKELLKISSLIDPSNKEHITLREIIDVLSINGQMILVAVLAAPFIMPIPLPGLSVILGLLITSLGFTIFFNVFPRFPFRWLDKKLSNKKLSKFFIHLSKISKMFEKIFHKRINNLGESRVILRISGLLIAGFGFFLALPLPPGTNAPPAIFILSLTLSHIEEDGLAILINYLFLMVSFYYLGLPTLNILIEFYHKVMAFI